MLGSILVCIGMTNFFLRKDSIHLASLRSAAATSPVISLSEGNYFLDILGHNLVAINIRNQILLLLSFQWLRFFYVNPFSTVYLLHYRQCSPDLFRKDQSSKIHKSIKQVYSHNKYMKLQNRSNNNLLFHPW